MKDHETDVLEEEKAIADSPTFTQGEEKRKAMQRRREEEDMT